MKGNRVNRDAARKTRAAIELAVQHTQRLDDRALGGAVRVSLFAAWDLLADDAIGTVEPEPVR